MEEQFVPSDLALKLKELGFDEQCFAGYNVEWNNQMKFSQQVPYIGADYGWKKYNHQNKHIIKAPLWQQAFDWFREKYGLHYTIWSEFYQDGINYCWQIKWYLPKDKWEGHIISDGTYQYGDNNEYPIYRKAQIAVLEKLIEICQEQKEDLEQKK